MTRCARCARHTIGIPRRARPSLLASASASRMSTLLVRESCAPMYQTRRRRRRNEEAVEDADLHVAPHTRQEPCRQSHHRQEERAQQVRGWVPDHGWRYGRGEDSLPPRRPQGGPDAQRQGLDRNEPQGDADMKYMDEDTFYGLTVLSEQLHKNAI